MLSETGVQNHIRNEAALLGDHLWRNNIGSFVDKRGIPVRFGLLNDSSKVNKVIKSSDLIGPTQVLITQDMVGSVLAVFTAVEVKEEGWKFNQNDDREVAQKAFHDLVLQAGGYAGFAQSIEDYRRIVKK